MVRTLCGRFCVVEDTAIPEDIGVLRHGVVLSHFTTIVADVLRYLALPLERQRIARRGRELFESQRASTLLEGCVAELLMTSGCS
jgi:hypothetical protein